MPPAMASARVAKRATSLPPGTIDIEDAVAVVVLGQRKDLRRTVRAAGKHQRHLAVEHQPALQNAGRLSEAVKGGNRFLAVVDTCLTLCRRSQSTPP